MADINDEIDDAMLHKVVRTVKKTSKKSLHSFRDNAEKQYR